MDRDPFAGFHLANFEPIDGKTFDETAKSFRWDPPAAKTHFLGATAGGGGAAAGAQSGPKFFGTTGGQLMLKDPTVLQQVVDDMVAHPSGGVIFIDEVYQLEPSKANQKGAQMTNIIMEATEKHRAKLTFIIAGYEDDLDNFLKFNKGLRDRFPNWVKFEDYTEGELHDLFHHFVHQLSDGKFVVPAKHSQAAAIVARRIARGRLQRHFGNARLSRKAAQDALSRAYARMTDEWDAAGEAAPPLSEITAAGPLHLTWEDILGLCPFEKLKTNYEPIATVERMIGFPEMKRQLLKIVTQIVYAQVGELQGQRLTETVLHQRFYGPQGTGKTTVAKALAKILADLGITRKPDVLIKTPNDMRGGAEGHTEQNVRDTLEAAREKVLLIDEAYMLGEGAYHKEMTNALLQEVQANPEYRPVIILAGYRDRMEAMLTGANQGLYRRIAANNKELEFVGDMTESDMAMMLCEWMSRLGGGRPWAAVCPRASIEHAVRLLELQRQRPNFGNGGAVENIARAGYAAAQQREVDTGRDPVVQPSDFGELPAEESLVDEAATQELRDWYEKTGKLVARAKKRGTALAVPFAWVIEGPAGSGKLSNAKLLLKMMNNMRVMNGTVFKQISTEALIGQAVGQSVPKLMQELRNALGGMLYIARSERLATGNPYAREVFEALGDALGMEEFRGKIAIVLGVGEPGMSDALFRMNPTARAKFQMLRIPTLTLPALARGCWSEIRRRGLNVPESPELDAAFKVALAGIARSHRDALEPEGFGNFHEVGRLVTQCEAKFEDDPWTSSGIVAAGRECHRPPARRFARGAVDLSGVCGDDITGMVAAESDVYGDGDDHKCVTEEATATSAARKVEVKRVVALPSGADDADGTDASGMNEALDQSAKTKEVQRQKDLEDEILDLQKKGKLSEAEKKKKKLELEKKQAKKLMRMYPCPAGYDWVPDGDGWRCLGAMPHRLTADQAKRYLEAPDP